MYPKSWTDVLLGGAVPATSLCMHITIFYWDVTQLLPIKNPNCTPNMWAVLVDPAMWPPPGTLFRVQIDG